MSNNKCFIYSFFNELSKDLNIEFCKIEKLKVFFMDLF